MKPNKKGANSKSKPQSKKRITGESFTLNKGIDFKNQIKTIFEYLQKQVATASMVSNETGIPQKNICRYKRDLEKSGRLWEIEKKLCQQTGFRASYLTTDPEKAPKSSNQLNLFE